MYNIAICDDDGMFVKIVEDKVSKFCIRNGFNVKIEAFTDSTDIVEKIEGGKFYDLYLLDIEMPYYSGMEILKLLTDHDILAEILFLTAHDSFAVDACGYVSGYIPKISFEDRIEKYLDKVFKSLSKLGGEDIYTIETDRKYQRIKQTEVIFIEKVKKYCIFHLKNGDEYRERIGLKELLKLLDNPNMFLLDRSTIINLMHVDRISGDYIVMNNEIRMPCKPSITKLLKERIQELWRT